MICSASTATERRVRDRGQCGFHQTRKAPWSSQGASAYNEALEAPAHLSIKSGILKPAPPILRGGRRNSGAYFFFFLPAFFFISVLSFALDFEPLVFAGIDTSSSSSSSLLDERETYRWPTFSTLLRASIEMRFSKIKSKWQIFIKKF